MLLLAGGCRAPFLSADDVIFTPDGSVRLAASVARRPVLGLCKDFENVGVHFFLDNRPAGSAPTNEKGLAELHRPLAPEVSHYEVRAEAGGQELRAWGRVFRLDPDRVGIVVDIDHTLADTRYRTLLGSTGEEDSAVLPGAVETLHALSNEYNIVYLTSRPRYLIDKTRAWLHARGFPPGPVITGPGFLAMFQADEFKTNRLFELRRDTPGLLIGIGDRSGDAESYTANSMLALMLDHDKRIASTTVHYFSDWSGIRAYFESNRAVLSDAVALRAALRSRAVEPPWPHHEPAVSRQAAKPRSIEASSR
jgi:hypothetical protein